MATKHNNNNNNNNNKINNNHNNKLPNDDVARHKLSASLNNNHANNKQPQQQQFNASSTTKATACYVANNHNNNNNDSTVIISRKWATCYFCPCETFKTSSDFVKHLRERHCTREGGSYVCRYGFNGVCSSLPLDGVSDRDYDAHVAKYHVNQLNREMPPGWSIFLASQNLPAVLNDPSRGKQSNLFTKKWGDTFVEKTHIPPSTRLPEVTYAHFEKYISKIGKRFRRHERIVSSSQSIGSSASENDVTAPTSPTHELSLKSIPEIFLKENLNFFHAPTFAQVFPGMGRATSTTTSDECKQAGRQLQEQLSHYLDIVEVKIAHQVSQKSAAFFHAMTSQDAIMTQMLVAARMVQELRTSLKSLHNTNVVDSFRIMRYAQRRQNCEKILDKLSLMATVHKTQPMLQLLLGTQDYVAALDLIGTTQEILTQELMGIHCFKHLPMQLLEMEKLIDKMLTTEFERYATRDLNRPLSDVLKETDSVLAEEDKLVCIVMGLLRKKNFSFVDAYRSEAIVTIRTIIKQLVIEVLAASDAEHCLTGAGEEAQSLSISEWISLLQKASVALLSVLQRIRAVSHIMRQTVDAAAGQMYVNSTANSDTANQVPEAAVNLIDSDAFLGAADQQHLHQQLQELLRAVCHYCQERCANLVSTQSLERSVPTAAEIEELQLVVQEFSTECEEICGAPSVPLRLAANVQATRYANRFHSERKQKLALVLDSERWRQEDIPREFQKIIERFVCGDFNNDANDKLHNFQYEPDDARRTRTQPVLIIEGRPFTLVGAALMLIQMLYDYCVNAQRLPMLAACMSRNVIDLLRTFNSRSCQLIIGTGALRVAGLKTITTVNLALVERALQLVLWLLPHIKTHFESLETNALNGYESIEKDFQGHISEIEQKIQSIVTERLSSHLEQWDARPPIPSQPFRNISRQLVKLHEAIAPILAEQQIHTIYGIVHRNFKDKLREKLRKHNIINNGGPQHGVVTSELTFYMETMRTLKALPVADLTNGILDEIWSF